MVQNIPTEAPRWIASYEHLAETLSEGYDMCIFEYTNDISGREMLERHKDHQIVAQMATRIAAADEKLRAILLPTKRCIHGEFPRSHFWYWMYPANSPQLESDLREINAI